METMATGESCYRVRAYLRREIDQESDNAVIYISTLKKEGIVFLRIDSICPAQ